MKNLKPIRTKADYEASLAEIEHLWGARRGIVDLLQGVGFGSANHLLRFLRVRLRKRSLNSHLS
jgi:antitoxin component HigA of HigAB toxin-antitoxin module